ncbi:MAG: hypothetical protein IIY40_06625 [Firmicutes bacterium]|nr:hypothetical protein [Bacillota bacterium]
MEQPKIKPVAVLKDALEAGLLAQVLKDEEIPFQIETNTHSLRSILGDAYYDTLMAPFDGYYGYARVWGKVEDEQRILEILRDVKDSRIVEEKPYLVNGRMWRIKKQ